MEERDEAIRKEVEAVLKRARNSNGAGNILAFLFPKVEGVLKTYIPDPMDRQDRVRARRISEESFAQSYFGLDPQGLIWSRAEIDEIVSSPQPSALISEAQRRIELAPEADRMRLRAILLDSLNGAFDELHPFTADWLNGFVEASPYFILNKDESPEFFGFDNTQRMRWIVISGLKICDSQRRYEIMSAAIDEAQDLSLLSHVVRGYTVDRRPDAEKSGQERDFFGSGGNALREKLLSRIKRLVGLEGFWLQADPAELLWFWASCGFEKEVRYFTDDAMETAVGLRSLLRVPISFVRSSAGNYEQVASFWSKIVDLEDLANRAHDLDSEKSTPEDRGLARRFLLALERAKKER